MRCPRSSEVDEHRHYSAAPKAWANRRSGIALPADLRQYERREPAQKSTVLFKRGTTIFELPAKCARPGPAETQCRNLVGGED